MAGYSEIPLQKKIGIKSGFAAVFYEPQSYWDWVGSLPENIVIVKQPKPESLTFAHLFVKELKIFERDFIKIKKMLKRDGMLWVSWPKKASKVSTELDENKIRTFGLNNGLVDVKVCAVDEVWSGLKFVFRLTDR